MDNNYKIIAFESIILIASIFLIFQLTSVNMELHKKVDARYEMLQAADKLRQSSDDLTHFARTYCITNNKIYLDQYFETLNIRNGNTPRPLFYNSIYWDLDKETRDKRHPLQKKESLKNIIKNLPFLESELKQLKISEKNSNELVNLELQAFKAIKNNNQELAIKLLHSKKYYEEKHNIMNPIDIFILLTNERTKNEINNLYIKINIILTIMVLAGVIFITGNLIIFNYVRKKDLFLMKVTKRSEKRLKNSVELFGEHVISSATDLNGIIIYVTKSFCKISGFTKEELIGQPHHLVRHPDMPNKFFKEMWSTIKSQKTWYGEVKNLTKQGETYWVESSIMSIYDEDDNHVGYKSIRHDITAQKAKEDFMANMSHELRTPLNAIIGFSSILSKKQNNKSHIELSNQIFRSSESLLNLINDILDLSKIQDLSFKIEPHKFNAYEEMVIFSQEFESIAHNKILNFNTNLDENLKAIFYGDIGRIHQIILNLISNSIKFTPNNGTIIFDVTHKDDKLIITVSDNGIGMNKKVQNKVFKPFEQADGSTTRQYGGTGLGLSITQTLVKLMNGTIELESQENIKTTFKVTIEVKKLEDCVKEYDYVEIQEEEKNKENTLSAHILIAEDNKTNQMLIKMLIEDFGLTCDIANDGIEAVDMYNPDKHTLILMDENMPNMNGLVAMKKIRDKYKDKCGAIIALTANAMEGDKERFLKLGMDAYIQKPINDNELYNVIKKYILANS